MPARGDTKCPRATALSLQCPPAPSQPAAAEGLLLCHLQGSVLPRVTRVPGTVTAPGTGHLLPGPLSQPHTALMLRCHLHACIRVSFCHSDPSPTGERVVTTLLCHLLNPPCPTTCKGDILTQSSSPSPRGRGHPPPGQILHVLPCPPISSCPTAPTGWSFCAAPCPWTRCAAAGRAWGQRTGVWL